MSTGSTDPLPIFAGRSDESVMSFIQKIQAHAYAQERQRDSQWIAELVGNTCLFDDALMWFIDLDEHDQTDWISLRRALRQRWVGSGTSQPAPQGPPLASGSGLPLPKRSSEIEAKQNAGQAGPVVAMGGMKTTPARDTIKTTRSYVNPAKPPEDAGIISGSMKSISLSMAHKPLDLAKPAPETPPSARTSWAGYVDRWS